MRDYGLDPAAIASAARSPDAVLGYLELHIEQGPMLEKAGLPVGVVTAISGASRLDFTLTGEAGHAGTVAMSERRDALAGAAESVLAVEARCRARRIWSGPSAGSRRFPAREHDSRGGALLPRSACPRRRPAPRRARRHHSGRRCNRGTSPPRSRDAPAARGCGNPVRSRPDGSGPGAVAAETSPSSPCRAAPAMTAWRWRRSRRSPWYSCAAGAGSATTRGIREPAGYRDRGAGAVRAIKGFAAARRGFERDHCGAICSSP